jgi:hypothetical protein
VRCATHRAHAWCAAARAERMHAERTFAEGRRAIILRAPANIDEECGFWRALQELQHLWRADEALRNRPRREVAHCALAALSLYLGTLGCMLCRSSSLQHSVADAFESAHNTQSQMRGILLAGALSAQQHSQLVSPGSSMCLLASPVPAAGSNRRRAAAEPLARAPCCHEAISRSP